MRGGFAPERVHDSSRGTFLPLLVALLLSVGLSMLFSASHYRSEVLVGNPYYFVLQQAVRVAVGLVVAGALVLIPLEVLQRTLPWMVLGTLGLLLLTFVPGIGVSFFGANRWIVVAGVSFQPSELAKFALVFYLSYILSRKRDRFEDPGVSIVPPAVVLFSFVLLVYLQNDFSTAIFLLFSGMYVFFAAGVPFRYFAFFFMVGVPLFLILLFTREHRVLRLLAYLDPSRDPDGVGYQIQASLRALSEGGFWGKGMGNGTYKYGVLPEAHSDFIFATVGEELGFVGVVGICLLFTMLVLEGFRIGVRQEEGFPRLLAFSVTTTLALQVLINLSVVCGLLPTTGVPLPFFSAGGSAALVTLMFCGLLGNLSRRGGDSHG